ncbi:MULTISPECIES: LysR family transcriptional regulator [Gordonibacter]|uniref:LysR family transcriptional regulator n=1 Tax=Gordonibacter faecis TaxID=3047475 RepID=A0ABT7DPS3_9ACTN|nr:MULTISPECIES: LysR family transcriptional regulator [unclassified Gordonibacter]MDJ1651550.1 LysR family transcriptional regulator [Gordonibacter sp. KGMB12511]
MRVEHMREFVAVANAASFTVAAEKMFVAQPVLSKHVHGIEETLGAQLINRSPKKLTLTPLGEKAYDAFEDIVERYDDLLLQMRRDDNRVSGKMRMGILSTGVGTYVMPLVTAFNRRFPNVSFTFMTEKPQHIVQSLMENKLDVGFVAKGDFNDMGLLSYRLIGHDLLKVALPADHPAVARGIVTPEDLAGNTLVCLKIKETTNALNNLLFAAGFKPRKIHRVDELEVAAANVTAKNGYFVLPDFMGDTFSTFGDIKVVDLAEPVLLPIYFAYKTANENPLIPLFLDSIEAATE